MSEAKTILIESPGEVKLNKYQYMPPLDIEAFADLKDDIAENGILQAILLDSEKWVIDGHHRIKAWKELRGEGRGPNAVAARVFHEMDEDRARDLSISVNTLTRQFTAQDKDKIAADIFISKDKYFARKYGDDPAEATNYAPKRVARMVRRTVLYVEWVLDSLVDKGSIYRPAYYVSKKYNITTGAIEETRQRVPRKSRPVEPVEGQEVYEPPGPPPPSIYINDEEIPLEQFEPTTTIQDISTGRVKLPPVPKKSEEEKAYDELIKIRRRTSKLSPARVAAVPTDRRQAQNDFGAFSVTLEWMQQFTVELKKKSRGVLRIAK